MPNVDYMINGMPLDSRNCRVALGSNWLAGMSAVRTVVTVPGVSGSVPSGMPPVFDERQLTIKVGVAGPGFVEQTTRVAMLCASGRLTVSRTVDGVRQEADAELVSLQPDGDETYGRAASYTIVLAIPGVWWRSPNPVDRLLPAKGGGLYPPAGPADNEAGYWTMPLGLPDDSPSLLYTDMPYGLLSSAPIPDAVIRLPSGVTSADLIDPVSGTGVKWAGSAAQQYTYVDAGRLTAWRSTAADAWDGGTTTTGVDYPAIGPLILYPKPDGGYDMSAALTGSDGDIVVHYKQSWW
ncbi:hypothetical protein [Bifidobacterium phasiani]|uniref:Tail fiber protein n=1 Tax=Bifidobacterium phasiani TaxID=2834431 RepID=A0ABS6W652_9BIFI|nr:hypothetical protein [Bifidobacterium phasiani]MBW3081963.1 hypothetical protein [Bifidobacterium phasiani]